MLSGSRLAAPRKSIKCLLVSLDVEINHGPHSLSFICIVKQHIGAARLPLHLYLGLWANIVGLPHPSHSTPPTAPADRSPGW